MARLLDIAILIGDPEAASMLAAQTEVRPLRRWEQNFFFSSELHVDYGRPILRRRGALLAALAAGGNFEGACFGGFTLREALVFGGAQWKDFAHLVPDEGVPVEFGDLLSSAGSLFGSYSFSWTLCSSRLRQGKLAGLALHQVEVGVKCYEWQKVFGEKTLPLSLLDVAILQGLRESAKICAAAGVGVKAPQTLSANYELYVMQWGAQFDVFLAPMADRREAASHASRTALRLTLRRELGERGWVLCKASPEVLVPRIVAFAMEEPQLVRTLMEDFSMPGDVAGREQMG